MSSAALEGIRVCDLTGQLAGAGATRYLAAMGAEVIRVEDPKRQGKWDILRGAPPFVDERRGNELGGAFNNHNVEKLGVTIDLRIEKGRDLLRRLVEISDVFCENFSAGVLTRLGLDYEALREVNPNIVYVSNSGFGHSGPYTSFRSWGSIVQACSGLTYMSGHAGMPPAGWGYSYMDHQGANFMAVAILAGLLHRNHTGQGLYIDMACTEAGASLLGPVILDHAVNGRRATNPGSNRNRYPQMSPHGIYPTLGEDNWIAIACRYDSDWRALVEVIDMPWARHLRFTDTSQRVALADEIDDALCTWTSVRDRFDVREELARRGVPVGVVARPKERIEDSRTQNWGLWPTVTHPEIGSVRVDGIPVHFSRTDWKIEKGAPRLGEHNDHVFGRILGMSTEDLQELKNQGVV